MGALLRDLRFAARMLAKSPGYTAVAVLTLALGIGANTAIFSTVHAVLLRPLPYSNADELIILWETHPTFAEMSVSYANFPDYRAGQRTLTDLAMYRTDSFNLTGGGAEAERVAARMVSPQFFTILGVAPAMGRSFTDAENVPGGARVTVLSHGLWQRRFGGDPEIVGKTIQLSGDAYTVIGVMGDDFRFGQARDLFVPIGLFGNRPGWDERGNHPGIYVIGRLKPGVTVAQARADLTAVGAAMGARLPKDYGETRPALKALHEELVEGFRNQLLLLFGAVAFVLLIAAANVANLMLARALTRAREMAIRASLGAGRLRLIRQLLVESALLSLIGAGLGLLLALWGVDLLASAQPQTIEALGTIDIDGTVLLYTIGVALATGLLFGLVPAIIASKQDLSQVLKEGDHRATAGAGRLRVRNLLVVGEVALALVLLVGAGLAIRGFSRLESTDPGFVAEGVFTMKLTLPEKYDSVDKITSFYRELDRRLDALPGVESASFTMGLPFAGASETSFRVNDDAPSENPPFTVLYPVERGYLETMKIPLLAGRRFNDGDTRESQRVAIIDEALQKKFYPDGALGKRINFNHDESKPLEIVGVMSHVAHYGLEGKQPAPYQMYVLWDQYPDKAIVSFGRDIDVVVRTAPAAAMGLTRQARAQVSTIDPEQPVYEATTLSKLIHDSIAERRFTMFLLGIFAALALVLAAVGLYAVMSHSVTQRTHEIGVRMALGAQPREVVSLVLRQGLTLVVIGLVFGLGGALGVTRLLQSLLSGVSPTDPGTFVGVLLVLVAVGLLATYIPARRATRVDPMIALRNE